MEKQLETNDYLVKNNGGIENDVNTRQQVIIVQEKVHLINVSKPDEFITQEKNTKEFENVPCPMFDSSQQPIYFEMNESADFIADSDDEPSNVFENTYLLPTMTDEVTEPLNDIPNRQSEVTSAPKLGEESEHMDVDTNKVPSTYAEVTLNEEQYDIFLRKGWMLVEMNDKVFSLDSAGLHEITSDHELITKLKHETGQIIDNNSQQSRFYMNVAIVSQNQIGNVNNIPNQGVVVEIGPKEIETEIERVHPEKNQHQVTQDSMDISIPRLQDNATLHDNNNKLIKAEAKSSKIHIKTRYQLKDIPKEIVLGKTINGKNLVARVIRGKYSFKNTAHTIKDSKAEVGRDRDINDKLFAKLVQQVLLGTAEKCRMEDVASAETVMSQMFQVPVLRSDLHKHKIIATKTVREENEVGLIQNQSEPAVVTGQFIMNGSEGRFVHIPDMLQTLKKNSDLEQYRQDCNNKNETTQTSILDDDLFLHINITETHGVNNISRTSVMVTKRYLSLSKVCNMKTKHINAVYACTACARVFKMQEELEDHRQYHCTSEIPVLPVDTAQLYTVMTAQNNIKLYVCNECKANFVKLRECREHLRTHYKNPDQEVTNDAKNQDLSNDKETQVFKCKMCDITYFHSSSLTKHILAKHIKSK